MEDWVKQSFLFIGLSIIWDIFRTIFQAYLTRWVMQKDFRGVHEAIEDVEDAIEEENGGTHETQKQS